MKKRTSKRVSILLLSLIIVALFCLLLSPLLARAETAYVVVAADSWLNGRAQPDKHSNVECRFYNGYDVDVLDICGEWAKLSDGGEAEFSYVKLDYLFANADGSLTAYKVTASGRVNIRKTPDGEKTGRYAKPGHTVKVKLWCNGWALTKDGWIDGQYLK